MKYQVPSTKDNAIMTTWHEERGTWLKLHG
jgi:hypothetical protein